MKIVSRAAWGAKFGLGDLDPGPEARVVIHHSYRPALFETDSVAADTAVRSIERYHAITNGWAGIGYNFLVAPNGRVYEGRGWEHRGAHAGPVNGTSIGICLLIDGSVTEPNEASIWAVRELIRVGLAEGHLSADYVLSGHRDHMPRTCPGELVYARLQEFRHDAVREFLPLEPEVTALLSHPPTGRLNLEKIAIPRREHVEGIVKARRLSPEAVKAGYTVVEVLLRAGAAGNTGGRRAVAKEVADVLAGLL